MTIAIVFAKVAAFAFAGGVLGFLHFASLRVNVDMYIGRRARARSVAVHVLRLAALGFGLFVIARFGAIALLSAFMGLLVARASATSALVRPRCRP